MRRLKIHIAPFLLLCFIGGSLVSPLVHQLQHGIDADQTTDSHEAVSHKHPDYDALSDESRHVQESDFTCVLCNVTFFSVEVRASSSDSLDLFAFLAWSSIILPSAPDALPVIRGPPGIG